MLRKESIRSYTNQSNVRNRLTRNSLLGSKFTYNNGVTWSCSVTNFAGFPKSTILMKDSWKQLAVMSGCRWLSIKLWIVVKEPCGFGGGGEVGTERRMEEWKSNREETLKEGTEGERKVAKEGEMRNDGGRKWGMMVFVAVTTTTVLHYVKACIFLSWQQTSAGILSDRGSEFTTIIIFNCSKYSNTAIMATSPVACVMCECAHK